MSTKKPWWRNPRRIVQLIAILAVVAALGFLRWNTLPTPKYFWPTRAEDWSAWGTCLGAIGTIVAVVYAARTLQSTSKAQLEEREDRRGEMGYLESKAAEEAIKIRPNVEGFPLRSDDGGHGPEAIGARIFVDNHSDHAVHGVQVIVPHESLEDGITLSDFEFSEAPLEWGVDDFGHDYLKRRNWSDIEAPAAPIHDPERSTFILGTIEAGKSRSVDFNFSDDEQMMRWNHRSADAKDPFGREMMLVVMFTDRNGKTWQRTSRDNGKIMRVRSPEL